MRYYFAGAETHWEKLEDAGTKSVLAAYPAFWRARTDKDVTAVLGSKVFQHVAIDSGAHSLQKSTEGYDLDKFVKGWMDFVRTHRDNPRIDWFAEMDIQEQVGLRQVKKWRRALLKLTPKIMPVWHPAEGIKGWKELVKNYEMVATGGKGWRFIPGDTLAGMSVLAYDAGRWHHGFGCTTTKLAISIPFCSIDSTSWLAGEQYGQVVQQESRSYHLKQRGGRLLRNCEPSLIEVTKPYKRRTHRMVQHYKEHEQFVTRLWEKRGIFFNEDGPCPKPKRKRKPASRKAKR